MALIPDTVSIVKELVSLVVETVVVASVLDNGNDTFTLSSEDTKHISIKNYVTIGATKYKVQALVQDVSFTIEKGLSSDPDPVVGDITLPAPFFINGTIISAKRELDKTEWKDKYPMVFLYEIYKERWRADKTDPIAFDTRLRLFFMDQTRQADFTTADQYEEKLRPMRSLVFSFLDLLESKQCRTGELTQDYDLIPWVNFGKFTSDKGNLEAFFNDEVSGYELDIEIPIKKSYISSN